VSELPEPAARTHPPPPPSPPPAPADAAAAPADAAAPAGDEPRRRRRRRRRRGAAADEQQDQAPRPPHDARERGPNRRRRGRPDARPSQHHAMTAIRSLSSMAQGLLQVQGVDFLSMPRFMDIEVRIPLDPDRDGSKAASDVIERILRRVKEVRDHERALQPGAVYSYFTETAAGEACRPKEPREVFDGYTSTGRPNFTDFVTMAIERKDQGIDELLAGEDVVITHVAMGRVLRTQQLAEFGKASPVYRILGQVDAGLFPVLSSAKKAAFSFQVLRGTSLEGRPRLRVHPVGAADIMDLADPTIAQILQRFQQRLDAESLRLAGKLSNGEAVDDEEFALPLLQELARQLEGRARRRNRRTKHADQRSAEGQRPTAKAYEDAEAAHDEDLLWDDRENTAVVVGPRGRVHVFTPDGKHVTSLVMQGSSLQKRRHQGQWRQAEPEERGEFRFALRRLAGARREQAEAEAPETEVAFPAPPTAPTDAAPSPEATAEESAQQSSS
jgi:hypothetical protein